MIATGMIPKMSCMPSMCGLLRVLGALRRLGDLEREAVDGRDPDRLARRHGPVLAHRPPQLAVDEHLPLGGERRPRHPEPPHHRGFAGEDRKSTRLNSSHLVISY